MHQIFFELSLIDRLTGDKVLRDATFLFVLQSVVKVVVVWIFIDVLSNGYRHLLYPIKFIFVTFW